MAGLFTATKVTSSRRAELLTTWRGSWMLEICGPIGTMRGCTGLIDDNLINKNSVQLIAYIGEITDLNK